MEWYLNSGGGPTTLDGLTSAEVKRLLGSLIPYDWAKCSTRSLPANSSVQVHYVQNFDTGRIVDPKWKIQGS
jgi:hypothetical protein